MRTRYALSSSAVGFCVSAVCNVLGAPACSEPVVYSVLGTPTCTVCPPSSGPSPVRWLPATDLADRRDM